MPASDSLAASKRVVVNPAAFLAALPPKGVKHQLSELDHNQSSSAHVPVTFRTSTARHLGHAITAASAVIDSGLPEHVKMDVVRSTKDALEHSDMRGLLRPNVLPGLVGANARAIGAASLPLLERFLLDNLGASRNAQHVT